MSDKERRILKMYDGSLPNEEDLFETSHVNQLAWTLVVLLGGVIVWLCIALVHAENQRFALASNKCQDPLFPGNVDHQCLMTVQSRDHWWQHLGYAVTHLTQSAPEAPNMRRK
ncbi:hypothetical protein [Massilia horti]|uniref:Uncharacterized protein n=1 Tax=Massilia horti TaxID=2562153 RepID=A0A4Y9SPP7_9BURK|nr:hypothetical protein [Massilia horti]TFW27309.1 hypothetical protein E4O92_24290 [Massilia horti]